MDTNPVKLQLANSPYNMQTVNWGGLYDISPVILKVGGYHDGFAAPIYQHGPFQQMSVQTGDQLGQNQSIIKLNAPRVARSPFTSSIQIPADPIQQPSGLQLEENPQFTNANESIEGFAGFQPNAYILNARYKFDSGSLPYINPAQSTFYPRCTQRQGYIVNGNTLNGIRFTCSKCYSKYIWNPTADFYGNIAGTAPGQQPPPRFVPKIICERCNPHIKNNIEGFELTDIQHPSDLIGYHPKMSPRVVNQQNRNQIHRKIWTWDYRPFGRGYRAESTSRKCKGSWDCDSGEVCFMKRCQTPYY